MATMATDSHSDDLDPDAVGRREFTRSRRGFDQIEVRAFLNAVAAQLRTERQRQVELTRKLADAESRATRSRASDAQRLTTVLGEETARIIEAAREAAEEMRERVEAETTQLSEDASQRLTDAKEQADAMLEQARADAVATRDQATTEAMAEVEQSKDRAREMVEEARAHRERVMHDVAKRRKGLRAQYQTLAGVRDQMLERLDTSQGLLGGAIEEVRRALNEEAQLVHPTEMSDEPDADAVEAAALDEERIFHRVRLPAPPSAEAEAVEESVEVIEPELEEESEAEPQDDDMTEVSDEITGSGEATEVDSADEVSEPEDVVAEAHEADRDTAAGADTEADAQAVVAEDAAADEGDDPDVEDVDELFAKLRAESTSDEPSESTDGGVKGNVESTEVEAEEALDLREDAAVGEPADDDEPDVADPRTDPFVSRDQALAPIDRTLQRQLKRVLADDQNGVLDRLRTLRGRPTAERVLVDLDDLSAAAGEVSADDLMQAYRIGAEHIGGSEGDAAGVTSELGHFYETQIAEPLRAGVTSLLEESDDVDELSEQVRAAYRTFRTEQLSEVSAHLVAAAYARGRYDAIEADTDVVWLQDPEASSPDCEDNELAGVVTKGTVFPTGSECAPAYEGCRCLVIPAALAPAPTEA
jgi:DivIVA domain-containing protein